jgi:hypothetical protein
MLIVIYFSWLCQQLQVIKWEIHRGPIELRQLQTFEFRELIHLHLLKKVPHIEPLRASESIIRGYFWGLRDGLKMDNIPPN